MRISERRQINYEEWRIYARSDRSEGFANFHIVFYGDVIGAFLRRRHICYGDRPSRKRGPMSG